MIRRYAVGVCLVICLAQSLLGQTGTFIDRQLPSDLRMLTYNPFWDQVFPDVSATNAAKFERIVDAVQPDIINLQEVNRSAADAASLLDNIVPLAGGQLWNAYKGRDNIIASPFPLFDTGNSPVPSGDRELAMARVDLPDDSFARDFYIMNNHYACCGGNDGRRQRQSDALVNWMRDARSVGDNIDLPGHTPMFVLGDLNIVGGPQPLQTVITGNIIDEGTYGSDSPPDWDGTPLFDARPLHNVSGIEDYTWRDDGSIFDPGRLDYVIFTDSVLQLPHSFVLNTREMSTADLASAGLQADDVLLDPATGRFDHLPLVTDFRMDSIQQIGDLTGDGQLDFADMMLLQREVVAASDQLRYDLNGDRQVTVADVQFWVTDIFGTLPGDANLDFSVDGQDFIAWNANKFGPADWLGGDFNSDGIADGQDFLVWNSNKFQTTGIAAVPEPTGGSLMLLTGVWLLWRRRRPRGNQQGY